MATQQAPTLNLVHGAGTSSPPVRSLPRSLVHYLPNPLCNAAIRYYSGNTRILHSAVEGRRICH
ncbi:MAG: hypothetical protein OXU61_00055 [Gammaproteobacteria bacterium]|nr:hypothetical protein [Gammaproteobacteria bacterium]